MIANNTFVGLDILGASFADIEGNYFGVAPAGSTQAANAKDIEITDTAASGFEATENQIGATIEGAALATAACDGGCNVISGQTSAAIDLIGDDAGQNEAAATGPTNINGNYVGLNAGGVAPVESSGLFDILAGAAEDVTIGGTEPGDANYIAGGSYGIYKENANGFSAIGNTIGRNPAGAGIGAPSVDGFFLFSLDATDRVTVDSNTVRMDSGIGIEQRFGGADITNNLVEEGQYGIKTLGSPAGAGSNLFEKNTVVDAELNTVLIENEENLLVGNVFEGAGLAAVRIEGVAGAGNSVGGDTAAEENEISDNGGDAVEIVDSEDTGNQVRRNNGSGNGGLFIDLGANGPGNGEFGPNNGIQPPVIDSAKPTGAGGSGAQAGATIRVFRKATASPGELQSFLGEAVADGAGGWSLTYGTEIPRGTRIAATQSTEASGASELAFGTTGCPEGGSTCIEPPGPPENPSPGPVSPSPPQPVPQTKIKSGPKGKIHSATAKFKFTSSLKGSKFECKLDRKKFRLCKSPKTYRKLKPGKHVFKVRAVKGKTVDPTPAKRKFRVLK